MVIIRFCNPAVIGFASNEMAHAGSALARLDAGTTVGIVLTVEFEDTSVEQGGWGGVSSCLFHLALYLLFFLPSSRASQMLQRMTLCSRPPPWPAELVKLSNVNQ